MTFHKSISTYVTKQDLYTAETIEPQIWDVRQLDKVNELQTIEPNFDYPLGIFDNNNSKANSVFWTH